jgi:hypothetical protein
MMPKVIITHDVADVETWLKGKADRAEAVGTMGGSNVVDHVAHDGSNKIAISADADDVDALLAAIASPPPELAAKMQEHGVIPPLAVYVER